MNISDRTRNVFLLGCLALAAVLVVANVVRGLRAQVTLMAEAPEFAVTPVSVDFTRTIGDPFSRQIREAVDAINDAVGCNVLSLAGDQPSIHIVTSFDRAACGGAKPAPSSVEASTYFCPDGSVDIVVDKAGTITQAYLIVQHELAHALGVPHAPGPLMTAKPRDWDNVPFPLPTLEPAEATAIRDRYCRRGE